MSISKNIAANYTSQVYSIIISIISLPLLLEYMGAEAYGLVGFFSMSQSVMSIFDIGMSATMSREIARFRGGVTSGNFILALFKKMQRVFFIVGVIAVVVGVGLAIFLGHHWFKIKTISVQTLGYCLITIVIIVVLRWISGYYKAVITGYENLTWLSTFNAVINTARFVLVFVPLLFLNATPDVYFTFQLIVVAIELAVLRLMVLSILPNYISINNQTESDNIHSNSLKESYSFAAKIAFTVSVWVLITQLDKLILSKLLPLEEYGYFSLAIQLAAGITLISGPISAAIIPRMSKLEAENNHTELIRVYRFSTQLIVVLVGAIAVSMAVFAKEIIFIWSGDISIVTHTSKYLELYAIGNLILAIAAFPYYLQYAKGNLKMHLWGNLLFLVMLVPMLIFATIQYKGIGAGWVWIILNGLYFFIWIPFVHHKFDTTLNKKWFLRDVFAVLFPMVIMALIGKLLLPADYTKIKLFSFVAVVGLSMFCVGLVMSNYLRQKAVRLLGDIFKK